MFIWSIIWFWFKIEYIVDVDTKKSFFLTTPSISYSRSYADQYGYREHQISISFLNLSFNMYYYYPANYFFNEDGDLIGTRIYPSVQVKTVEFFDNIDQQQ